MKGGDPVATKSAKIAHCIRVEPPRPVLATTAPEVPSDVTFNEMLERAKLVVSKLKSARAMKAEQGSLKLKPSRALAQELQEKCMLQKISKKAERICRSCMKSRMHIM